VGALNSTRRGLALDAQRITHDARRTTHDAHDARRMTRDDPAE
jgi:hypothetical protein